MKRKPLKYNSVEVDVIIKLSSRTGKTGEVFFMVDYTNNNGTPDYVCFNHLSSALDFINTNFKM